MEIKRWYIIIYIGKNRNVKKFHKKWKKVIKKFGY